MGGMRIEITEESLRMIEVSVSSFVYRLRSAESLLAEETLLMTSAERQYLLTLMRDLREAAEDGSSAITTAIVRPGPWVPPQADLGEEQF